VSKYIAIDLDSQGVFVVSGLARSGGAKVERAVAWAATDGEGGPPPLTNETAKRLGEELRDRLRAAGVASAPVVVAVGRDRVVLKELRYPVVPAHEEPNIVRFQAMKELSDSPEEVVLDYVPLANGAASGERRSMAVAVRKDVYSAIQKMCAAANLKLTAVTPRPYAIAALIGQAFAAGTAPAPDSKADAVAVLTLGPGGGEFTVVRNGEVTFTLAVPAPVVASETMLLAQVRRNLTTYAGSNPGHPVQALYVADADDSWGLRFRPALGIPVHAFDPLGGAVRDLPEELRGRFAGAAGLLAARGGALPINFAAPRQPRAEADPKKNQILVAALAAMLLLAAGAVGGWFVLNDADAKLSQLKTDHEDKKKRLDGMEPDKKRLDAVDQWKARRVVWLDELYDWSVRTRMADSKSEGVYANLFHGKERLPNTKTGKQDYQATLDVRVVTRRGSLFDSLLAQIDMDNPRNDPKTRYYPLAPNKKTSPIPPQEDKLAQEATISVAVNSRPPTAYTRPAPPGFEPPSRKDYPPLPGKAKDPKARDTGGRPADTLDANAAIPVAPPPKVVGNAE
jgi:hypothetical protein